MFHGDLSLSEGVALWSNKAGWLFAALHATILNLCRYSFATASTFQPVRSRTLW